MRTWIVDLDGSLSCQDALVERYRPEVFAARSWGPRLRLACRHGAFRSFEQALWAEAGRRFGGDKLCTLYGSGDFHHVSLALLRRLMRPINLLVIDKHPDWMRGIPFLHCGTWLRHAARLPTIRRIFHVGGDLDFDNHFRGLAPWPLLRSSKIVVFPAVRRFEGGAWDRVHHRPLCPEGTALDSARVADLLAPHAAELARWPLYISIDKDVLAENQAAVNWDSGRLTIDEVRRVLFGFVTAANGNLAGMDCVGDWSAVQVRGVLRRLLHWIEHPAVNVDAARATSLNAAANLALLDCVWAATGQRLRQAA